MSRSIVLALVLVGSPAWVAAQGVDSLPEAATPAEAPAPHVLRWWQGVAAAGALSTLMVLDHPVQRYARQNSGSGADNVAAAVRHFGQPEAYLTVTLGMLATGMISGHPGITRSGGRLALALALAGATTEAGKVAFGRPRPEQSLDADGYTPFSGQVSMPSGHTAAAFALATSLADDIHNPVASVGLYGLSTAVGWSRINDNRHWFTDVAAGALVGITSAKLASGRWRIFNLHPPSFIAGRQGAGLGWQASF
jgi:membrane-associated phospholipid phosphatase